jgi:transposase, IS5 family
MKQPGFFDLQQRHESLDGCDPLVALGRSIPWPQFAELVRQVHARDRKSAAGRPAWDAVVILKALVLGRLYNLSDDQLEYQIRDRLSFMRFLGLQLEDRVPDAKTLWLYRERLTRQGLLQRLFDQFEQYLHAQGYQARQGQIVDASIVPVPRQRNTREQNEQIKSGELPPDWLDQPMKRRQKDCDARWVVKHGERHYGYKNHVSVDVRHRFVRRFQVSSANVHDSQHGEAVLDERQRGRPVYGDGAYRSVDRVQALREAGYIERLHYKGHRHQPLTAAQRRTNHRRSRIRVRVEHVFGFQENSMGGKFLRCIGIARARFQIGMMNLVYNFMRYVQLQRLATTRR